MIRVAVSPSWMRDLRLSAGISAVSHLWENVAGAALTLSGDDLGHLGGIGS